ERPGIGHTARIIVEDHVARPGEDIEAGPVPGVVAIIVELDRDAVEILTGRHQRHIAGDGTVIDDIDAVARADIDRAGEGGAAIAADLAIRLVVDRYRSIRDHADG